MPLLALPFPMIDPVMIQFGPLAIHWYGMAYVAGILFGWWYARRLVANVALWPQKSPFTPSDIDDFLTWAVIGIIAGGRLGYVLFYEPTTYLADPLRIVMLWSGGMSFHGGLLGTIVAMILFSRSRGVSPFHLFDIIGPRCQFHQPGAFGQNHRNPLGRCISCCRSRSAPSQPAL